MFCVYCGEENPEQGKYCRRCGKVLIHPKENFQEPVAEQFVEKKQDESEKESKRHAESGFVIDGGTAFLFLCAIAVFVGFVWFPLYNLHDFASNTPFEFAKLYEDSTDYIQEIVGLGKITLFVMISMMLLTILFYGKRLYGWSSFFSLLAGGALLVNYFKVREIWEHHAFRTYEYGVGLMSGTAICLIGIGLMFLCVFTIFLEEGKEKE